MLRHRNLLPAIVATAALVVSGIALAAPASAAPKPRLPITLTSDLSGSTTGSTSVSFSWTSSAVGASYTCTLDGVAVGGCTSPWSYSGLAEGSHTFVVTGKLNGSYRPGSATRTWTVDITPPGAPTVVDVPSPTSNTSALVYFSNNDPSAAAHTCALDGASPVVCTSPWSTGTLGEGDHTVVVQSRDFQGILGGTDSTTWTVDLTAPASVQVTAPTSPATSADADITFSAAGATSFACSLDGGAAAPCTSPWHLSGLSDGQHTVTVSATDGVGNAAQPGSAAWTVDTTAPAAPTVLTGPANPTNQTTADVVLDLADPSDSFECRLDTTTWSPCPTPLHWAGLAAGSHLLDLRAVDEAGNAGATTTLTWVVDVTAPTPAQFLSGPAASSNLRLPSFDFVSTDPTAIGFQCKLDGGSWVECEIDTVPLPAAPGLAEGAHVLSVVSVEASGNLSSPVSWSWHVDLTAPAAPTFVAAPAASTSDTSARFELGTEVGAQVMCSVDGGAGGQCASPFLLSSLTEGDHTLAVTQTDAAGNTGPTATHSWTVDTTAPAAPLVLTGPADPTNETTADVELDVADPTDSFECRLDTTTWSLCPTPLHWSGLAEGTHVLHLRAVDEADNAGAATTLTWDVDLTAPAPAQFVDGPDASSNVQLPDFVFASTDLSSAGFKCQLDGGGWVACTVDAVPLPGAPGLDEGSHVLSVVSVDAAGNVSSPVSWTWDVDLTAPPALDFTVKPASSTTDTSARFEFATEAGAQAMCSVDGAAPAHCASPFLLTGLSVGGHALDVTQTDAAGNTGPTATYAWTVTAPVPPVVTPPTPTPTPVVAPTTVSLTASRALTGRSTATFSTAVTAVTGGLSSGGSNVPVTVRCTDAGGAAVDCQSGGVRGASVQPAVRLVPGQTYVLQVSGTDAAGRPASASATFRASTAEQESSLAAGYRWGVVKTAKAYGRSYLSAAAKGSALSTTFRGTSVTWYTMTGPGQGRATVYVDGVAKGKVNNWSAATRWHVARTVKGLKAGTHTLKVVVAGKKGSTRGTGTGVAFDAVKVGKKLTANPRTTATWSRMASASASGRFYAASAVKGSTAAFTFRGTSVTWLTARGPAMGKAKVYVDGVLKLTVDSYAKKAGWNIRRSLSGLTDRVHTVTVKVTGTKRRASTGTTVVVDRWLVG
jgi:hypothetical protein